ncbi:hypothetical protein KUS59_003204 [Escherichia coli]|nr:hypothetical protein [Escherichia coli]EMD5232099.1 hypothetical protein [Escherichia coli]
MNARKAVLADIRRQLVLPTRANYTGRTLQCDIKSRLLLPSLSFSCSFHLSVRTYRSGELILTHFSGEPLAAHTIDHRLTMVDLFCCTGTIAGQVPAAGSEVLSRVNASGREVLTRVLVAGKRSPSPGMAPG